MRGFCWLQNNPCYALWVIQPDVVIFNSITIPGGAIASFISRKTHIWYIHEFGRKDHKLRFVFRAALSSRLMSLLSRKVLVNSIAVRDKYASLTLLNESCFGPLFDLGDIYALMESREIDFWGMTRQDSGMIDQFFNQTYPPNETLWIRSNLLLIHPGTKSNVKSGLKVAVHFHVFYPDVFERILPALTNTGCDFDKFITTDTSDTKAKINAMFQGNPTSQPCLKEIQVLENRGRDVAPWLQLAGKLADYDLAGHFHAKKTGKTT